MSHSEKEKREFYTLQCRFYNGEDKAPKTFSQNEGMFWFYEQHWVTHKAKGDLYTGYLNEYPDLHSFEANDKTPLELKALLCDRYCHFGGVVESFKKFYLKEYQPRMTNKERRTLQRRAELTDKCRYFKGEERNLWEYCYAPVLVWRRKMWDIERKWVEALSDSFKCPQNNARLVEDLGLVPYFKKKDVPLSLINLVLIAARAESEMDGIPFGSAEAIKVYEKYVHLTPLGRDHRLYFAYYLGDEECLYKDINVDRTIGSPWDHERMQLDGCRFNHNFSEDIDDIHKEGIGGWYANPIFPMVQKQLVYFMCCNVLGWSPYCDVDKLAEDYLNYHYPGEV